jgi:hypothetical protein
MAITRKKYGEPRHAVTNSPSLGSNLETTVSIFHPGFSDGLNKFLTLPAIDYRGIHCGTALTICGTLVIRSVLVSLQSQEKQSRKHRNGTQFSSGPDSTSSPLQTDSVRRIQFLNPRGNEADFDPCR